jgi:hypothetical protein
LRTVSHARLDQSYEEGNLADFGTNGRISCTIVKGRYFSTVYETGKVRSGLARMPKGPGLLRQRSCLGSSFPRRGGP